MRSLDCTGWPPLPRTAPSTWCGRWTEVQSEQDGFLELEALLASQLCHHPSPPFSESEPQTQRGPLFSPRPDLHCHPMVL